MKKEDIIADILNQRNAEEKGYALFKAVARAEANVSSVPYSVFWLYNSELLSGVGNYKDQRVVHNKPDGFGIAKNSKLGEVLITRMDGSYTTPKGNFNVQFKNIATYSPVVNPRFDAVNGTLEIVGKPKFRFRSAYELLNLVDMPSEDKKINIEELMKEQAEAKELGRELTNLEEEQLRTLYETTRYIRENNELRQQPILDPVQEAIKRSRIFNGVMIIDGGPGTGKTTTLIQRIKFLIDLTLIEYWEKAEELLPELQGEKGWIFFSPSTLLLGFLQNAMTEEGLKASNSRTKVWSNFLNNEILINYGFTGPDKQFHLYRQPIDSLLNNEPSILSKLLGDLEAYMLRVLKRPVEKARAFKIQDEGLRRMSLPLVANAGSLMDVDSIAKFIQLADELAKKFGEDIKMIETGLSEEFQAKVDLVFLRLSRDKGTFEQVASHLKEEFEKKQPIENEEESEDEIPIEVQSEIMSISFNEGLEVRRSTRRWLRQYFLNQASQDEKIPEKQKTWVEAISQYCYDMPAGELGMKLLYVKNIVPLIAGSGTLFFNRFAILYKRFRRTLPEWFGSADLPGSADRMNKVLNSKESKLHYDERCLMVLFLNSIIRQLQRSNAVAFRENVHHFIKMFKERQRYIVGIDEASDFSLIELACMHSFSHPFYDCTTLSGDLMQRMTKSGMANWDYFVSYLGDGQVYNLETSYRQSPTLLQLAKEFYERVMGKTTGYKSYSIPSTYEPRPEVKGIADFDNRINWIAEKILNIYKAYGNRIPSIAIFSASEEIGARLSSGLKNCDMLADAGIDIQSISQDGGLTQKGKVGVFNIENIKGLEFEAVFFVDIDKIENANTELLQKYIYVGLSRAAYYLYISYRDKLPDGLDFLSSFE